ncbi:hypothetical protein B296_00059179 [Ensete ventricosum]|uniref:Uncharacterized protein n=1 Tax=Ensete ventricosum TaxID=4639 RepID=A0A426XIR7_ENSVE|nr:hypothetical protein B296_00059179 [Ensete ventricosum]
MDRNQSIESRENRDKSNKRSPGIRENTTMCDPTKRSGNDLRNCREFKPRKLRDQAYPQLGFAASPTPKSAPSPSTQEKPTLVGPDSGRSIQSR